MNYPKLIRFKEKHEYRNFVVDSQDDYHAILVQVARERLLEGYWYSDEPNGHPDMFRPNAHLSDAETIKQLLMKLDNPSLRKGTKSDEWYRSQVARWMRDRRDYEYEGFDIENVESVVKKVDVDC